jgi:hypothetical protein
MRKMDHLAGASVEMEARAAFACSFDEADSFERMRLTRWWRNQSLMRRCWLLLRNAFAVPARASH